MFKFLKASPPAHRIDEALTDAQYRKLRYQVFAGVFIGYVAYYLIRKNFSLAISYLIDEYGYSKADLGSVGVVSHLPTDLVNLLWVMFQIAQILNIL